MTSAPIAHQTSHRHAIWTNSSVVSLASGQDPIETITAKSREAVFSAIQAGWSGPPYDPFALAEFLKISVEPSQDVIDARTKHVGGGKFRIEYNPTHSRARINFSVAHEIAHTLFPDCAHAIRNRYTHADPKSSDWQLEMLCNIAAAEMLMPTGSFLGSQEAPLSIDSVIKLQREFSVSSEAVLLRIAKLTHKQCLVFVAHRDESQGLSQYRVDYAVPSRAWPVRVSSGFVLPTGTVAAQCTAIGHTAKAEETWSADVGPCRVECLGTAPYPGHVYPRVVGIIRPLSSVEPELPAIEYLRGDATLPRAAGPAIIVQIVNDKAITWGRGFSVAVRKRWPQAQRNFTEWVIQNRHDFKLGNIHTVQLGESLELASLVAQHGFGPSLFPRIQYPALEACLMKLVSYAKPLHASLHMPRIGSGEARGDWKIISEIIDQRLCREDVPVTVYDLPEPYRETPPPAKN